jgi:hypothetical protein
MKPVRTADSNMVYRGPSPEVQDLHCERIRLGEISSVWWLTPAERDAIAGGANIELRIMTEPIPPTWIGVTARQGVGEDAPDILERLELVKREGAGL